METDADGGAYLDPLTGIVLSAMAVGIPVAVAGRFLPVDGVYAALGSALGSVLTYLVLIAIGKVKP